MLTCYYVSINCRTIPCRKQTGMDITILELTAPKILRRNDLMKKRLIALVMAALLLMSLASTAFADDETYTLTFACTISNTQPASELFEEALAEITERTDGAITFNTSYNGALGNEHDLGVNIVDGAIDMALVGPGEWANYDPAFYVFDCPFLYDNYDHFHEVLNSDLYKDFLKEKGDAIGMEVLVTVCQGMKGIINSKRPVYSPEDLNGLKIRVPDSDSLIRVQTALGGIATPIAASEQYTALSQGIIDGADHSLFAHCSWQLYDYAKYYTETNHALQTSYYVISAQTMSSLPQEYQDIIREVMAEQQEAQYDLFMDNTAGYEKTFTDNGGEIVRNDEIDHEAFNEALADIIDEFSSYDTDLYEGIRAMAE